MNGVPTFGEYIRRRRTTANLTRPRLAWLANLSVPYLTKIESGANPSRRVIESLSTALELRPDEFEYALALAEGPLPRAEDDHPDSADLEYLELLEPKIAAFASGAMDILAVNRAHRAVFPQLNPGLNYLEWLFLEPVSRTILVDWAGEAEQAVRAWRLNLARFGENDRMRGIIANCTASPEFAAMWHNDTIGECHPDRTKLVRDPKTLAVREIRLHTWRTSSSLRSWMLILGTNVDTPAAVARPAAPEGSAVSRAINAPADPADTENACVG